MKRATLTGPTNRREFLSTLIAAGAAGACAAHPGLSSAAEPPPETRRIRLVYDENFLGLCLAPQYVATELLRLEGFEEVEYTTYRDDYRDSTLLAEGAADITAAWAGDLALGADRTGEVVVLSGLHLGCTEVFANDDVGGLRDLAGRKIALVAENSVEQVWFSMMLSYIGLDPERDVEWVIHPHERQAERLMSREVDALMMWPPSTYELREQGIGHVIFDTTTDRPWRDYFCCMLGASRSFVAAHPVAAKRAVRAILKATDLCASDPQRAVAALTDQGLSFDAERTRQALAEIPYGQWREFDPLDTLRFYMLRLHEVGMLASTPDALLSRTADFRFLDQIRRELKA